MGVGKPVLLPSLTDWTKRRIGARIAEVIRRSNCFAKLNLIFIETLPAKIHTSQLTRMKQFLYSTKPDSRSQGAVTLNFLHPAEHVRMA